MYYKKSNSIGIRQKFKAKTQIFSFGGKRCPLGEGALRGWGDDVLKRLENQNPKKVERWIKAQIKELSK